MNRIASQLQAHDVETFRDLGFLRVPNWCSAAALIEYTQVATQQRTSRPGPLELESDLGYPGAPKGKTEVGGNTPRRLLKAFGRCTEWDAHATSEQMKQSLSLLFGRDNIFLTQAHHNCLMTKSPRFSSDTGWHRDSRYWHFEKTELITAWLALGDEKEENGCLRVIPGSHKTSLAQSCFDKRSFVKQDHPDCKKLLLQSTPVELNAGDLLFFHCDLLHSASRNFTNNDKLSLVFTYYTGDNAPIKNTRSSEFKPVQL